MHLTQALSIRKRPRIRRSGWMADEEAPPIIDPVWAEWSAPLLEFLIKAPRTWKQINKWREKNGMTGFRVRQCVAWLEDAGAIRSEGSGKKLVWKGMDNG